MMAASRTWNLRLNLDEFNALAASVYTDIDRALLFQGMTLGFNGGECPIGVPSAFARAYQLGADARQEAEAFRTKMGQNGSRGGRPAHRQDPGEHEPDQGCEEPAGKPEGNQQVNQLVYQQGYQTSTQSTIHNPLPQTPNEQQQREREEDASGRMSANDWEPLQEHRELCAMRNASCDLQLARFRERNVGTVDTDQGWSARFMQWIGKSRPERSVPAEAVASPTLEEWMGYAREVSRGKGPNGEAWPKPLAEAGWHENQAKGWRFVQDWKADCNSRALRWSGYEETTMQRNRRPR